MIKCYKEGYYRPQFVREQFEDLCGEWDFIFDDQQTGEQKKYYKKFPADAKKIIVPFTYETIASNIHDEAAHSMVWYRKKLFVQALHNRRYLLHFEGVDYLCKVWINGHLLTIHEGGYCRFSVDATDYIKEDFINEIVVCCKDSSSTVQPRGKQRWQKDSFGCWYVQTTGIWKPVWSEIVPLHRLENVKITPDLDQESVRIEYDFNAIQKPLEIITEISFDGIVICKSRQDVIRQHFAQTFDLRSDEFLFKLKLWSPESPNLYDVTFTLLDRGVIIDKIDSYFGLRKIAADEKGIRLNNSPYYQKLILAQNYWKDTGLTLPDDQAALQDILYVKEAGFNGVRIHQKIEDERFLFYCDLKGLLVWSEFPSTYEFNDYAVKNLVTEWTQAIIQLYNHPSIITWVPFNESWGIPDVYDQISQQNFTKTLYMLTKTLDPSRPVITNDGWEHTCSDIITLHDYDGNAEKMKERYLKQMDDILENKIAHGGYKFAFAEKYHYQGQPIIISEYGGIALSMNDGWGYNGKAKDEEELVLQYRNLTMAIRSCERIGGYCYTQLTDTYQEVNGLLDENHKPKTDLSKIKRINE